MIVVGRSFAKTALVAVYVFVLRSSVPEDGSVMLVDGDDEERNEDVVVASRNLPWFSAYPQRGANVYAILKHQRLFITPAALEQLTERLTRL